MCIYITSDELCPLKGLKMGIGYEIFTKTRDRRLELFVSTIIYSDKIKDNNLSN